MNLNEAPKQTQANKIIFLNYTLTQLFLFVTPNLISNKLQ